MGGWQGIGELLASLVASIEDWAQVKKKLAKSPVTHPVSMITTGGRVASGSDADERHGARCGNVGRSTLTTSCEAEGHKSLNDWPLWSILMNDICLD